MLTIAALAALAAAAPIAAPGRAVDDYSDFGPYEILIRPATIVANNSTGCSGTQCEINAQALLPNGPGPFPLAVFSPGFQQPGEDYLSYGEQLASWGFATVMLTLNDGLVNDINHRIKGLFVIEVMEWADRELETVSPSLGTFVLGHSAGGKSSVLAVPLNNSPFPIKGIFALDPVDCKPDCTFPDNSECVYDFEYPSAAQEAQGSLEPGSLMIIGAELGNLSRVGPSCAPEKCSQRWFFEYGPAGTYHIEFLDTGHSAFTDTSPIADVCVAGSQVGVVPTSRTLMTAWAFKTVYGTDVSEYLTGSIMDGWVREGLLVPNSK